MAKLVLVSGMHFYLLCYLMRGGEHMDTLLNG
jgi:hypothetical protein